MLSTTLINPTVLFILALAAIAATAVVAKRLHSHLYGAAYAWEARLIGNPVIITVLLMGAMLGVFSRLYLSYLAPGDILQNTISAREFAEGRSLYPTNLNRLVNEALQQDPPREPLSRHVARLKRLQQEQFAVGQLNLVNAHPPLFTLLLVPLVLASGIYVPAIFVNIAALGLFGCAVYTITAVLFPSLPRAWRPSVFALALGWQPVLASVRHANQSLVISALVLLCWYFLRKKRDATAGIVLALAICLKIYPCIILLYLIIKRRKAFLYSVAGSVIITFVTWIFVGTGAFSDFIATSKTVASTFGIARNNASLFSVVDGTLALSPGSPEALGIIAAFSLLGALTVAYLFYRSSLATEDLRVESIEYSIAICLICLLSPIVWPHYFSLLLLPIACLAKYGVSWSKPTVLNIILLVFCLAISLPDQPLHAVSELLQSVFGERLGWCLGSAQTLAILGVLLWLIALDIRARNAVSPSPDGDTAFKLASESAA